MRTKVDRLSFAAIEQQFPLGDTARGMLAVVAPILNSLLLTINVERLGDVAGGDHRTIKLRQLAYLHRMSDGARGTAFEYAVHHGVRHCDRGLVDPLLSVLEEFGVGDTIDSIFFAREKQGVAHLIDPERHVVTESTLIVPGPRQDPMSLHGYLPVIGKALRQQKVRAELPPSIAGFWKADLLIGNCGEDVWLGTTVKSNLRDLEAAPGIAVGVIPCEQGKTEVPHWDEALQLWVVPVPYDDAFMEAFSRSWCLLTAFLAADAKVPSEAQMPDSACRKVAGLLAKLRDQPVVEVVALLSSKAEPGLVTANQIPVTTIAMNDEADIDSVVPTPMIAAIPVIA